MVMVMSCTCTLAAVCQLCSLSLLAAHVNVCLQGAPVWRRVQQSWAGHEAEAAAHGGLPWPSQHAGGDVWSCSCCKHPILLLVDWPQLRLL